MASYQFRDITTGEVVPGFFVMEASAEEIERGNQNLERACSKLRYVRLEPAVTDVHTLGMLDTIPA